MLNYTDNIQLQTNNIQYPLIKKTCLSNSQLNSIYIYKEKDKIISGNAFNVQNFIYNISAFYSRYQNEKYLIGIITGYYFYKSLNIENIFKENKNNFIFTNIMTNEQKNIEILDKNIISTKITVIPSTVSLININNNEYNELDFIKHNLSTQISEIWK